MSRDPSLFVDDMITACDKILRYVARRPQSVFESDEQAFDAVLKNLEVIGEAAKRLPVEVKDSHTEIAWRDIAGLRDIIVHGFAPIAGHASAKRRQRKVLHHLSEQQFALVHRSPPRNRTSRGRRTGVRSSSRDQENWVPTLA